MNEKGETDLKILINQVYFLISIFERRGTICLSQLRKYVTMQSYLSGIFLFSSFFFNYTSNSTFTVLGSFVYTRDATENSS